VSAPRVSVLTAVRNGGRFLAETIASIQAQTFTDWEYILVDDASGDDTSAVIEEHMRADSRLRLFRRERCGGPYAAANDGVRAAQGEYIVRIDGDDLCPPYRVERQLLYLATHPQYRACVSFVQLFDDDGVRGRVATVPTSPPALRWYLLLRGMPTHSSLCIERAALAALGSYCELPLAQDHRLMCELSRRDWLGVIPEVLSFVRVHPGRSSVGRSKLQGKLALDVVADHIFALTGERWPRADIETLFAVGHSMPLAVGEGLHMLDRWDRLWQAVTDLTREDRRALAGLSGWRRWKHLRGNAMRQPIQVLVALARPSILLSILRLLHSRDLWSPRDRAARTK
jgi:hypothetical protein